MIIKRIKADYKTFFTKVKKNKNENPPKTKKLKNLTQYSIPLDVNAWSFKKRINQIGINLNNKMFNTYLKPSII